MPSSPPAPTPTELLIQLAQKQIDYCIGNSETMPDWLAWDAAIKAVLAEKDKQ